MQFSKTSQYAIRALVFLAKHQTLCSVKKIHISLDIPYKYLTRLMSRLEKEELVKSHKGRDGGYCLTKDPKDIYLADVLHATGEFSDENSCILGFAKCDKNNPCILHEYWAKQRAKINEMIKNVNLAILIKQENTKL